MTKTILATFLLATILLTSAIVVATPAYAVPVWTASGPGTVTVTDADQGDDGLAQFEYAITLGGGGVPTQTWTFETTATTTGPVTVFYDWNGFHAFFQVTATLKATDPSGTTTLINEGPVNCCSAPSGGFHYTGSHTFDAVAGQTYSFTISGSNFDSNSQLTGTFTVASPPTFGLNGFAQQVTDLKDDLAACQAQNSQLSGDLTQCQADNTALNQQVTDLQDDLVVVNQQVTDLQGIIAGLESTIADLQAALASLPENIINSLIDGVNSLIDGDMLDAKDAKQSLKKLNEGLDKLQQGNEKACHEVEKFVKEINKLVDKGDLDAAKAQPLLDEANSLLAQCPVDADDDDDDEEEDEDDE